LATESQIQKELKQTKPFVSKRHEAAIALLRTADMFRRAIATVIEPHGITAQQYNVLRILRGAGDKGLPTLEIAERMIEQTPGITRLLDRLETKKFVNRERCKTDRRQVFCTITRGGLALLKKLDTPINEANSILGNLRRSELDQLIALLDRARDGVASSTAS